LTEEEQSARENGRRSAIETKLNASRSETHSILVPIQFQPEKIQLQSSSLYRDRRSSEIREEEEGTLAGGRRESEERRPSTNGIAGESSSLHESSVDLRPALKSGGESVGEGHGGSRGIGGDVGRGVVNGNGVRSSTGLGLVSSTGHVASRRRSSSGVDESTEALRRVLEGKEEEERRERERKGGSESSNANCSM